MAALRSASCLAAVLVIAACSGTDTEAPGAGPDASAPPTTVAGRTTSPSTVPSSAASVATPTPVPTSAVVSSGPATGAPAPLPPAPTPTVDPAARDFSAVGPIVSAFVADQGLDGAGLVVVDREDGIVHESYWGEFSADRVSLIASSSKMITAGVLMKLHDDGLLAIDAPVADTVDWATGHHPEVTVAQLLSNSSGLPGLFSASAVTHHVCQFMPGSELERCGAEAFTTAADDADTVPPDTEFRYGGVQWQIAGAVAETVSGKTWAQLIDEIYVRPCGVTSLGYGNHWAAADGFEYPDDFDAAAVEPTENPNMEGGAYITPPDYATLLLMHLRDGDCPNGRVMSGRAIGDLHEDRTLTAYGDAGPFQPGYGMGWWVDRETGQISDAGAYGSVPWLDLDDGYGVFLVVEAGAGAGGRLAALLNPVIHDAMTAGT